MAKACARCGKRLPARSRRRFCDDDCKQAAYRARKSGRPESLTGVVVNLPVKVSNVVAATRAELEAADQLSTHLGQAALALAERIDNATAVMGFAALVRELRDTMVEAVKDVEQHADTADVLRAAALRVIGGA
jgi:hypothetical protein